MCVFTGFGVLRERYVACRRRVARMTAIQDGHTELNAANKDGRTAGRSYTVQVSRQRDGLWDGGDVDQSGGSTIFCDRPCNHANERVAFWLLCLIATQQVETRAELQFGFGLASSDWQVQTGKFSLEKSAWQLQTGKCNMVVRVSKAFAICEDLKGSAVVGLLEVANFWTLSKLHEALGLFFKTALL